MSRLAGRLAERGVRVRVYDDTGAHQGPNIVPLSGLWVNRFVLSAPEDVIHYHSHSWGARMRLAAMTLRGRKVVFTFHSVRNAPRISLLRRPEFAHMMARAHFIAVNPEIAGWLREMGAKHLSVICPYISPPAWDPPDPSVAEFAREHEPVLAVSAMLFRRCDHGDLYGLSTALEAFALLSKEMPRAGLVLYISQAGDQEMFARFNERTRALRLADYILLRLDAPEEFGTCLGLADVFIRPSMSDSFGMSIAEARERGVRVVASDAATRPGNAALFRAGDPADLARAVRNALASPRPDPVSWDSFESLWEFYAGLGLPG